jgi:hypothetical protein
MSTLKELQRFAQSIADPTAANALASILKRTVPDSVNNAVTAFSGGGKTSATILKADTAFHNVATVATAADSIKLPAAVVGEFHFVKNSGAAAMQVFGSGTDTIDSVATATGVSQAAGDGVLYFCVTNGNYLRIGGVDATEVFTTITATTVNATNIDAGASGTAGSVDVFPSTASRGKLILSATANDGNTNVTLTNAPMAQASTISIPDPGAATANVLLTSAANDQALVTATSAELNYNDIAALGTLEASKAWTSDGALDTVMPTGGLLTVQSGGAVTMSTGSTFTNNAVEVRTAVAAEHGAGAVGTSSFGAPQTRRWTNAGVITTQIKFDVTGLASVATANDVIGLAAGGAAYIGRNVEATNGVIFKAEISCLETPLTGDNDINVVANASAVLAYDGAAGTTYVAGNLGDLLKGQTVQNLLPALTEGDYFYLTAGTGDTAATYTAGMYVLTLYGHAAL